MSSTGLRPLRAQDLPVAVGKVNDFAGVLDRGQRTALEAELDALEQSTSAEVAVVTMQSLGARTVEEYATALFNAWGIGKKSRDNGVLILVAVQDRAMRIEVGYGLEGILPDGLAGAIIRETFLPRFRKDDYRAGVLEGTARVVEIVRRHETLTLDQRTAYDAGTTRTRWGAVVGLSLLVALGSAVLGLGAAMRSFGQSLVGLGLASGGLIWSSSVASWRIVALLALLAVGVAVGAGWRLARNKPLIRALRTIARRHPPGPAGGGGVRRSSSTSSTWSSDSSSSGGSSSGSSSSSDFGGGSSGGGGASGRW